MGQKTDAHHGKDHIPGGADPIPNWPTGGSGSGFFPVVHSMLGLELESICDMSNNEAFSFVNDSTAPFGGYIESVSFNTDLKGMIFGLGPLGEGTAWGMDIWAKQGPDVGKLQVSFATTPSDELSEAGFGSANSGTSIDEVGSFSGWFVSGNTGVRGDLMDCYNAAPIAWTNSIFKDRGRIATSSGTSMLTGNGTASGLWSDQRLMNGGGDPSVYWWMKLSVNGKNASSTKFGLRIAGWRMYRQTAGSTTWWAS